MIVHFDPKDNLKNYVGRIMSVEDIGEEIQIQFLRRTDGSTKFFYPEIEDISYVKLKDIKLKHPKPSTQG